MHCGTYHGLQRLVTLLLARLAPVLRLLPFWWHVDGLCCSAQKDWRGGPGVCIGAGGGVGLAITSQKLPPPPAYHDR